MTSKLLLVICLFLAACNQPYQETAPTPLPTDAPVSLPVMAAPVSNAAPGDMFLSEEPAISVSVCKDANVYTTEDEASPVLYVIPAGTHFQAYAVSAQWVTVFPDRQWEGHKTQAQYIRADTLC